MKRLHFVTMLGLVPVMLQACSISPIAATSSPSHGSAASPYVGQQARAIKALAPDEVDALLAGKGMGLAKAAELNGYAGPAHVLELAVPLALTPEQKQQTEALFASMQARAQTLGAALVSEERKLDDAFAGKTVTPERLVASLDAIAALQARLRAVHLEAHLAQVEILSTEQNLRYASLRGYGNGAGHDGKHRH